MEAITAIHTRHSVPKVKPEAVPRELVEKLLSAAVQAPNHYKNRPWRFVVLTGAGRERLGEVMARSFKAKFSQVPDEALTKERQKPLRAPVLIAVGVERPSEPKIVEIENICAVAAACQNILLAANALGLGAMWRTGEAARDPEIKKFLGFEPEMDLVSFIYVGYPDFIPDGYPERAGFEDHTVWID
ncbi:MAG TPA: nitroreductase [Anaerolineales bacterium]|jgi:nitroreductase